MTIKRALEIVLELAEQNQLDDLRNPDLHEEMKRQAEAIEMVQGYDFQFAEEENHQSGCVCADCQDCELSTDND